MSTVHLTGLLRRSTRGRTPENVLSSLAAEPINLSTSVGPALMAGTRPATTVSGGAGMSLPGDSSKAVTEQLAQLSSQLGQTRSVQETIVTSLSNNTQALTQNTQAKSTGSALSTVGNAASSFLGSGFGLSPLITGLFSLFTGGTQTQTTVLSQYVPRPSIQSEAGVTTNRSVLPVDYNQNQAPRADVRSTAPQVTVQVNAIDSKSFLDHSDAIAAAVKQAILNSNSLNDVLADL